MATIEEIRSGLEEDFSVRVADKAEEFNRKLYGLIPIEDKIRKAMPVDYTGLPDGKHFDSHVEELADLFRSEVRAVLDEIEEGQSSSHSGYPAEKLRKSLTKIRTNYLGEGEQPDDSSNNKQAN